MAEPDGKAVGGWALNVYDKPLPINYVIRPHYAAYRPAMLWSPARRSDIGLANKLSYY
jgi:hypothetical protein